MELRYYCAILRRWWWLLVLGTALPTIVAYALSSQQPKVYQATTTLLVNASGGSAQPTYNDSLLSLNLVKTYSQMAAEPVVLEPVIRRLGLSTSASQLAKDVSVSPFRDTQLMNISVQRHDRAQSRDIANTIAAVFIQQQDARLGAGQAANAISVVQPAVQPVASIGPRVLLDTAVVAAIGLLLASGLIFLIEYLNDTVQTPAGYTIQPELGRAGFLPSVHRAALTARPDGKRDHSRRRPGLRRRRGPLSDGAGLGQEAGD